MCSSDLAVFKQSLDESLSDESGGTQHQHGRAGEASRRKFFPRHGSHYFARYVATCKFGKTKDQGSVKTIKDKSSISTLPAVKTSPLG